MKRMNILNFTCRSRHSCITDTCEIYWHGNDTLNICALKTFSLNFKCSKPHQEVKCKGSRQQELKPASLTANAEFVFKILFTTTDWKYLCSLAFICARVCVCVFTREKSETRWDISQPTLCSGFAPVSGCGRSPQVSTATETKVRWLWKRIRWLL